MNQEMVLDKQTIDEIVEAVTGSTLSTFSMICGEEPQITEAEFDSSCDGIMGLISMFSDYTWSLMLSLTRDTSVELAERFTGMSIGFESEDMCDFVGEMANVLAGDIAARLEEMGIRAELSLPTVVRGTDVELTMPGALCAKELHFACAAGRFSISIVTGGSNHARRSGS